MLSTNTVRSPASKAPAVLLALSPAPSVVRVLLAFPVNCSCEVDPQQGPPTPVVACTCPNCTAAKEAKRNA